jgi:chitinase domain-containing protein 1
MPLFYFLFTWTALASLQAEILASHSECKEDHKHFKGETLAYLTPWNTQGEKFALKYPSKFTFVSPVWHELNLHYSAGTTDFALSGEKDENFIKNSKGKFKLTPRIIISRTHPRAFLSLLHDDELIDRLGESLVRFCRTNSYDGLVFEFWLQGLGIIQGFEEMPEYRKLLQRMMGKIAKRFKNRGLLSILTLPPMRNQEINAKEFAFFAQEFDRVNLMTYDFSPAQPGPNSPLPWIAETLSELIEDNDVKSEKILLGVPFYGYDYQGGRGRPVTGKEFIQILGNRVVDHWEEDEKEHSFHYEQMGKKCVVFYPTLEMIQERLEFANKRGYGVGIWELGQGLEYFFTLF